MTRVSREARRGAGRGIPAPLYAAFLALGVGLLIAADAAPPGWRSVVPTVLGTLLCLLLPMLLMVGGKRPPTPGRRR